MQKSIFTSFEHKCVLEVCAHICVLHNHPSFNKKDPPSVFLIPFLKSGCSEIPVRMT